MPSGRGIPPSFSLSAKEHHNTQNEIPMMERKNKSPRRDASSLRSSSFSSQDGLPAFGWKRVSRSSMEQHSSLSSLGSSLSSDNEVSMPLQDGVDSPPLLSKKTTAPMRRGQLPPANRKDSVGRSISFDDSLTEVVSIPRVARSKSAEFFYDDEEIAKFRNEAFLEKCGLDPESLEEDFY